MIVVRLRQAMEMYKRRTGRRMTYQLLSEQTGIAHSTLRIIGSRHAYNATLATVEKICWALDVPLSDLLELIDDRPKGKAKPKPKRTKKKK